MNVLIVKLGAIGDIVHTLPALSAMREAMPDARLSWAVERRSAEILRGNPLIDELIEVDTRAFRGRNLIGRMPELRRQMRAIKGRGFDAAIDFQGLLKSAAIAKLSGARHRWGFSRQALREPASRVFLTDTVQIPDRTHVIRKNLLLAGAALGFHAAPKQPAFPVATEETHSNEADRIAERAVGRFAVLNPAGGWATKLWPADRYGQLADKLWEETGLVPVIATGPGEEDLSRAAMAASRSGKAIAAQPSLKGFFELARRASLYVGGDTGPTHLAVAAGTPVVGIYGPTEWWRNGSPRAEDICVERADIGCRIDCHRRTCSNWICMEISVAEVLAAAKRRLASGALTDIEFDQAGVKRGAGRSFRDARNKK